MSYNTIFKDLTTVYSTWNELRQYLESDAGGRFRVVDKKDDLCLIRYQKGHSRMDLPHSKWFRSVVWNTATNQPISIAPPKVSMYNMPFNTFQEIRDNSIVCQEQMDGFMINCFRKVGDETLYITSRSKLDAAGHFYSSKSFRTLFIEAYMKIVSANIRDIENHYYSMLFAFFTILSGVASGLLLTIFINYNVINGPHCSHTFFYIVIINCLSSIIPVVLFILYLI